MKNEYCSQIYKPIQAFIYCFICWLFIMAFFAFLALKLKINALFPIGFICTGIVPFLFQKRIKDLFTKRAIISFDNESFSITTYSLNNEEEVKKIIFKWDELKSYKFYFTPRKLTYMDIYLKNGTPKEFGFKDNKTEEESINGESIYSIFRSFVNQYNSDKEANEKIDFSPGFLTTGKGLFILCCLGTLIIVDIILHITKYDTHIGFLIIGAAMLLGLIAKRKQQKAFYEKMSNLK